MNNNLYPQGGYINSNPIIPNIPSNNNYVDAKQNVDIDVKNGSILNFGEEKITYETSGVDYSALIKYRSNIRFAPSGKSEGFYINCSLKSLKNQIFRVNGTTYHNGKAFNQNIHKE